MKNKFDSTFLIFIITFSSSFLYADTLTLKSGKTVEGKIIEQNDEHVKIDFQGTEMTYFMDEIEKIEADRAEFVEKDNNDEILQILRNADEYVKKGELDKTEEIYKNGLKKFPDSDLLWSGLAGNTLDQGRIDEAIEYCNKAVAINSCSANAYFVLGLASAGKGDEDKAIQHFQKAIECAPLFDLAYYDLGISYMSKKRYSDAVDIWVKGTLINGNLDMYEKIKNTFQAYIDNASAATMIIQKMDSSKPWIILPPLEISQKKLFEGLRLEYVLKIQVQGEPNFEYYINMGGINYLYKGDLEKSMDDMKMALSMVINNKDLLDEEKQKYMNYIHRLSGDIYLHKVEYELAEQNYQEALKFDSQDTNSLVGLGIVDSIKGDFDKAREKYRKVLELNPDSPTAQEALRLLENK